MKSRAEGERTEKCRAKRTSGVEWRVGGQTHSRKNQLKLSENQVAMQISNEFYTRRTLYIHYTIYHTLALDAIFTIVLRVCVCVRER